MSNNRDALARRPRRRPSASGEIAWQQTYPDELLEQLPDRREGPEDVTGDAAFEPLAIDVLRARDGVVTEIVTLDRAVFRHFGPPATLGGTDGRR